MLFLVRCTSSLSFNDILPEDAKLYDKMRPPKKDGNPTVVYFHVTVMGLDSIDENSMVGFQQEYAVISYRLAFCKYIISSNI